MDRLLTAPRRGLAEADAPPPGYPEIPPVLPRNPAARAPRRSPDQSPARRVVLGVLVGALTMLGVASIDTFGGATVPVLGSFAAMPVPPAGPEFVEVPPPPSTPGTCLTWSRADAADTAAVDCAQPHLFEQAGSITLTDQVALPDDRQLRQLVTERCTPVVVTYLGGKFDPVGRYRVGALKPSPAKWEQGDRELRCGLQSASRSGALYPLTGRAAENDQSNVQEPGTCLGIDGRTIGDPVDCAGPHAVETVGIVDLSGPFPDGFPPVGDQDGFLQPECGRIAGEYIGDPAAIAAKGLTVYWDNVTEASWAAGSRRVNCNLAALLPDRSGFAPVTGAARGSVVVGGEPAPPAVNTPVAGVPAPPVTSSPPAPVEQPATPPVGGQEPPVGGNGGVLPTTPGPNPPVQDGVPPVTGQVPPPVVDVNPPTLPPSPLNEVLVQPGN